MRTTSNRPVARLTGTALGLTLAAAVAYGAFGAAGCTVTTVDNADGGTTDTGVVVTDTGAPGDTMPPGDTNVTPVDSGDTGTAPAVIIPAAALIGGAGDDVKDFGKGSTYVDIVGYDDVTDSGGKIWSALGASGGVTSSEIGRDATSGALVDGKMFGLPAGVEATITVTGYLRGFVGDGPDAGSERVAWATTTCKATPSATGNVTATCTKKDAGGGSVACTKGCLQLLPTLKGVLFTADILPDGYCAGKGATDFSLVRARQPFSGTATVSRNESDCRGVIWVPLDKVTEDPTTLQSDWSLSLEPKGAGTACSLSTPCTIKRKLTGGTVLDVYVVGTHGKSDGTTSTPECQLTNASTGGTCF